MFLSPPIDHIRLVLRPVNGKPPSVTQLNLSQRSVDITEQTEGFILVTGPTDSGKTTLIAALMKHLIQTQRKHVLTTEAPIEYDYKLIPNRLSRVTQSEVGINIASFFDAVGNGLRRSPRCHCDGRVARPSVD